MVVQSEVHKYNIASIDNLKLHIRQKKKKKKHDLARYLVIKHQFLVLTFDAA